MNDNPSSVTILILDFLSIAAILSTANAANVTKLITKKYINSTLCLSKNFQNASVIVSPRYPYMISNSTT